MYFGNVCQTGLPSLARPAMIMGGPQPSPEQKPRLPFQLLPAFSEMDHIHKALIGPGFRLATPLKRKSSSCGVCRLRFNSEEPSWYHNTTKALKTRLQTSQNKLVQASSHYGGTKHAKRIKALDSPVETRTNSPETTLFLAKDTMSPPPLLLHLSPPAPPPSSSSSSSDTSSAGVEVSATSPPASEACPPSGPGPTAETTQDHGPPDGPGGEPSLPPSGPGAEEEKETEMETHRDGEEVEEPEALETESEEEKARRLLYCSLCKVAVNSASQLQAHNSGTKHKTMLEARSGDGAIKSFPRSGVKAKLVAAAVPPEPSTGLQNKTFHCEICDVHVNSETQLKQHISSRRHKDRAAGKPAKPKFSPYAPPPQRLQSMQAVRLALRKDQDLSKQPLASCSLLQRHLAAAAAAAMTSLSPFHLRPAPSSTGPALFHQTQPSLTHQALLHHHHHHHHPPPPASTTTPICSALNHTPVLFSPY